MELARISAKIKRLKDWEEFILDEPLVSRELKELTKMLLSQYRQVLALVSEKTVIDSEDQLRLADIERQLDELNNQARLQTAQKTAQTISSTN